MDLRTALRRTCNAIGLWQTHRATMPVGFLCQWRVCRLSLFWSAIKSLHRSLTWKRLLPETPCTVHTRHRVRQCRSARLVSWSFQRVDWPPPWSGEISNRGKGGWPTDMVVNSWLDKSVLLHWVLSYSNQLSFGRMVVIRLGRMVFLVSSPNRLAYVEFQTRIRAPVSWRHHAEFDFAVASQAVDPVASDKCACAIPQLIGRTRGRHSTASRSNLGRSVLWARSLKSWVILALSTRVAYLTGTDRITRPKRTRTWAGVWPLWHELISGKGKPGKPSVCPQFMLFSFRKSRIINIGCMGQVKCVMVTSSANPCSICRPMLVAKTNLLCPQGVAWRTGLNSTSTACLEPVLWILRIAPVLSDVTS